jgi:hypothetical protein
MVHGNHIDMFDKSNVTYLNPNTVLDNHKFRKCTVVYFVIQAKILLNNSRKFIHDKSHPNHILKYPSYYHNISLNSIILTTGWLERAERYHFKKR